MSNTKKSRYQRVSIKVSTLCALLGILVASALTTILFALFGVGFQKILFNPWFRGPIAVAVVALFVSALLFGLVAGNLLYRFDLPKYGAPTIGVALALLCFLISVTSGALSNFLDQPHDAQFSDYFMRPLVGIVMIGAFPATILGLIYSAIVRREILRQEDKSFED